MTTDVASPVDLRDPEEARAWERSALARRPERPLFFEAMAAELASLQPPARRVLDLGSGPGFLAEHLLRRLPALHVTLLDFSAAMQELARARLQAWCDRADHRPADFTRPQWTHDLADFDAVVAQQSVHETRHKAHAPRLYREVRAILRQGGVLLVADHFAGPGGQANDQLFMSVAEQREALVQAGFGAVRKLLSAGGMVLHRAQ